RFQKPWRKGILRAEAHLLVQRAARLGIAEIPEHRVFADHGAKRSKPGHLRLNAKGIRVLPLIGRFLAVVRPRSPNRQERRDDYPCNFYPGTAHSKHCGQIKSLRTWPFREWIISRSILCLGNRSCWSARRLGASLTSA